MPEAVGAYYMQTSIAYIMAGYRKSLRDDLVDEMPGKAQRLQKNVDTTINWFWGISKENLPLCWQIALLIYVGHEPSVFLYH